MDRKIIIFSFLAELTFWEEYQKRFNFIAVDYLVYTHEVVGNINESYPLPILLSIVFLTVGLVIYFIKRKEIFSTTFQNIGSFKEKTIAASAISAITLFFFLLITNKND